MLIAAAAGLVLSLLQYTTGDHTFALLFPWRISAVLVPVATAIILANVAAFVPDTRPADVARGVHHRRTGRWRNLDHGGGNRLRHR